MSFILFLQIKDGRIQQVDADQACRTGELFSQLTKFYSTIKIVLKIKHINILK